MTFESFFYQEWKHLIPIAIDIVAWSFLVLWHELAHVLTAKVFHMKTQAVHIGMGPLLFSFNWGAIPIFFHLFPLGGRTLFKTKELNRLPRVCHLLIYMAGPLSTVFLRF